MDEISQLHREWAIYVVELLVAYNDQVIYVSMSASKCPRVIRCVAY